MTNSWCWFHRLGYLQGWRIGFRDGPKPPKRRTGAGDMEVRAWDAGVRQRARALGVKRESQRGE